MDPATAEEATAATQPDAAEAVVTAAAAEPVAIEEPASVEDAAAPVAVEAPDVAEQIKRGETSLNAAGASLPSQLAAAPERYQPEAREPIVTRLVRSFS